MTSPGQDDLGRIQDLITWSSDSIRISSISSNTPALQLWPDTPEGGHLANWLYAHFYADCPRLFDALTDPLAALGIRAEDPIFYQTLRAAFPGTGYVDNGWRVTGLDDRATVQVEKDGVTLHADRAEIASDQGLIKIGAQVGVLFPKDALLAALGFYVGFSNAGPAQGSRILRIYVTAHVNSAAEVLNRLADAISTVGVPATIKICSNREQFRRRDNTVVYVSYDAYPTAISAVKESLAPRPELLRPESPAFTKRIGRGIAVAEEPKQTPGNRFLPDSFGMSRCRVIAAALLQMTDRAELNRAQMHELLRNHVQRAGLDPDRLHLSSANASEFATAETEGRA